MPRISIGPAYPAAGAPTAVFVDGLMLPGVKTVVDAGGDILVVLDRAAVRIDPARVVETELGRVRRIAYPTDGAA